jgi:hypothetical protein
MGVNLRALTSPCTKYQMPRRPPQQSHRRERRLVLNSTARLFQLRQALLQAKRHGFRQAYAVQHDNVVVKQKMFGNA